MTLTATVLLGGLDTGEDMVTAPLYVPGRRPSGSTRIWAVEGMVPVRGVALKSHAPWIEIEYGIPGAELARLTFCSAVGGPFSLLEKVSESRDAASVGAAANTERMRLFPPSAISRSRTVPPTRYRR